MIMIDFSRLGSQITFILEANTLFRKFNFLLFNDTRLLIFFDFGQLIKVVGVTILIG